ncbi:hypothetical protein AU476_26275 [Cupriavidus sp. UYMSc13B]|nr:hypothetical protein AU476_26275 [Cupriavidus sp. UYMSc13B]
MRSMSACARDHTFIPGKCPFRFIGSAERIAANPECISPQMARQWARAARSSGSRPALGQISFRYSAIASVSHTVTPWWRRHGTRIDGDSSRISARAAASSGGTSTSSNSRPAKRASSQPRSDHEE